MNVGPGGWEAPRRSCPRDAALHRRHPDFHEVAHAPQSAGWILNGGAVGQGLSDVVTAFVVSDPRFRSWLLEQVTAIEGVGAMSEKAKNSKLKAVGEKIRLRPGSPAMFLAEMLSAQATARGPR